MGAELARALDRAYAAVNWWLDGLWIGMPARAKTALFAARKELTVRLFGDSASISEPDHAVVTVSLTDPGARAAVGAVLPHDHEAKVTLVLPRHVVLVRSLRLPAAVEADLRSALHHELDRLTPFASEDIAFDYRVRGRARDLLLIDIAVMQRQVLAGALESLAKLEMNPAVATTEDERGDPLALNLLPRQRRLRLPIARLSVRPAFAVAAAVLAIAALYLPLARYERVLAEHATRVEGVRSDAVAARATLTELEASLASGEFLAERRRSYVPPIALLRELTAQVPDHTWLSRLSISRGEVLLQGESAAATDLVQLLESAELLDGVRFQAPVARSDSGSKEQFTIVARLAGNTP